MRPYKTRDIENSLCKKGFQLHTSKHKILILYVDGKKSSIKTIISHGIKEYSSSLMNKVKKELKLQEDELIDLINCPLDKDKLLEIYKQRGVIKL